MIKKAVILFVCSIIFISCNSDDDLSNDLTKNRQLWQSKNIKSYKWSERLSCFCGGPLERDIFVVNAVKDRVDFDTSEIPTENLEELTAYIFNSSKTIEEAFDFIEDLLTKDVASLAIEYDKTYGFPTLISIDYYEDAIDDEIAYIYSNFELPLQLHQ